jgi:hypothetical protein
LVIEVTPNINSVVDEPQLSNKRHPLDGALVVAGSLWPCSLLPAHCTVLFRSKTYFVKSNDNEKPGLVVSFLCLWEYENGPSSQCFNFFVHWSHSVGCLRLGYG